jgi:excisionase family DNA binding protein
MPQIPKQTSTPDANLQLKDVGSVARRLGVSTKSVRRAIAAGDLTAHRLGRLLRVADSDLEAYLARRRIGG